MDELLQFSESGRGHRVNATLNTQFDTRANFDANPGSRQRVSRRLGLILATQLPGHFFETEIVFFECFYAQQITQMFFGVVMAAPGARGGCSDRSARKT